MPKIWPFGRKATRLKEGGPAAVAERKRPVAGSMPAARAHEFASRDVLRSSPARRQSTRSNRRRRRSSRSSASLRDLEKDSPTLKALEAQSAALAKEQGLPRNSADDNITALPNQRRLEHSPHLRPISQQHGTIPYNFSSKEPNNNSQSSLPTARERGKLQRPQSLRKSVHESGLVRRISSKKQKREHEHLREEEIRAMSMPLPQKRPAGKSGDMLRRDSKKVKGSLNRRFERPESNISLPLEDSIHSSMSGNSDHRAFRVSALDMFSPRPTVRCSVGSQYYASGNDSSPLSNKSRSNTNRGRQPGSRDAPQDWKEKRDKRSSRIDDLADELDTGALREIMDRDQRRREKKRKADDERLRRRLERRAEKQQAAEAAPLTPGTPTHPRKGAQGTIGLGIERDADVPTHMLMEDVQPSTPQSQRRPPPLTPQLEEMSQLPTPLESPMEEPVISNAQAVRYSRGSVSATHTRGPSNVSQMPELLSERFAQEIPIESIEPAHDPAASGSLHVVDTTDTAATSKMSTDRRRSSEGRRMAVFASFFRRGKRRSQDPGRTTPSEVSFSNTSRESMSRQPLPAHLVAPPPPPPTAPIAIKRPSSVPRRTRSKFREDLPEFTPPDSRVQSPEIIHNSAIAARRRSQPPAGLRIESDSSGAARTDSPVSPGVPNGGVMSQSLASVDSEGSWLSGKPIKRSSNKSHLRSSVGSSTALKTQEPFSASYEELGIPDDEYFRRLTPQPDEHRPSLLSRELSRKPSSMVMSPLENPLNAADSDNEEAAPARSRTSQEDEELMHSSIGRHPTVIHHQARVKSREGLLSFYHEEKPSPEDFAGESAEIVEGESPTSENEPVTVQRARSVDLGKHHFRHLSAGSAKLLDIQKRASSSSQSKLTQ
ncbi:hypothetical protein DPSP01_013757 [Paraphaeosphaeria sporulosa]|uniref:Uncharacterized protein n=1 Tax=Paraphaeosphaeria sporulosa TaxID=1460663 RepID=A0A177CR70_9PLEO|nr:uncharacterized protein CC84DRAFT_459468 [Paraphaeosphaeria sporulosa]OAG10014.1 hypothetical protein CC84DRAFT_459468 [Paraphaeosphaeria sporulosa]